MGKRKQKPAGVPNIRDRIVELRRVPASSLLPHEKNWKDHPDSQRQVLNEVLEEIGFAGAALTWLDAEGILHTIDGHMRAEEMGDQLIPVLVTDLTKEEADVLLATYDPLGTLAKTNQEKLQDVWESVQLQRREAIAEMVERLAGVPDVPGVNPKDLADDPGPKLEKADELREWWNVEPGQLWQIGEHRLLCGDCTVAGDVDRLFGGLKADMLCTDPPYGVDYGEKTEHLEKRGGGRARQAIANDTGLNYREFFAAFLALVPWADYNTAYVFMSGLELHNLRLAFDDAGMKWGDYLIWAKNAMVLSRKDYNSKMEHIVYGWKNHHRFYGPTNSTTILEYARPSKSELHPTMKPVELVQRLLEDGSAPGSLVYEPFAGSGTTLVAAAQSRRRCFALEIDPKYVAVVIERLSGMGLQPRLLG